ncbi:non-ribosomal peptide synthetase [bacterium]|nr:non-ribosomal peptide synthetase [bacterium]
MSFPDFHGFSTQPEWVVSGHWDGSDSLALSVHDFDESGSFRLYFDFNCDVFDEEQRSQAIQHFLHILDGFIENRTQPISHVSLLSEEEKQRILVRFNQTAAAYPANQTIVRLFETQAQRIPDRVAVTSNGQALTYAHLNAKANQLARHLQQFGVGPDTLVAIYMDRSLEIVIGILGILKAGGAYVPLDPAYPQERLAFMLEDTLAPVLLTQQRLFESLPEHKAHTVCLDTDWEAIARESKENPVSKVTADNLAYVIYTSGSTGKPKGAMVQHKSLVNYTETASVEFALAPSDYVLQFASISFDAAAEEIFPCLARGATLILRTDSMLDSIPTFLQKCRDWALTVLDLPTAYWHELTAGFDTESLTSPPSLRLVIIGGEKALPEPLVVWQKHVGQRVRLVNTYGPTEATVVATMCELSEEAEANTALQEVPIGRAIRNVQLYVLNRYLQPVPIGVPGELHIGGVGLARGYLNRPELTAEKFIPNPFSNEPGTCLYKTGDLVRYLPDGNIEFLGRMDHQVKIRGFRVELGEIEVVLSRHPAVQEAVVLAREHGPGDKRLVAYVVPNQKQVPITRELRRFLKENLPDYMLPSAFVMLEKMPLTPNGKVDRSALPAPDTSRSVEEDYIAPRTPTEELLAAIWAEVLGLEQVGIRDNFFELGGNSLLATQVISRVYETFQMKLPLTSLFEKPTVGNLAESIETVRWAIQELQAPPSDMGDDQEEIEL